MDARAKMIAVELETLFVALHGSFVLMKLLFCDSSVVVSRGLRRAIIRIFELNSNSLFKLLACLIPFFKLVVNSTEHQIRISIVCFD